MCVYISQNDATLRRLLPLRVHAQQRTHRSRQPDKPIIQIGPAQRRRRDRDIAQVAQKLHLDRISLPLDLLPFDHALRATLLVLSTRDLGRRRQRGPALAELVQSVEPGNDGAADAREPEAVALAQQALGGGELLDARGVERARVVAQHVAGIAQLAAHGGVAQHGVHGHGVRGYGRGFEVLDELADAHQLAGQAELLLGRFKGRDGGRGVVCAVEVPGEEAREVL